MKKEDKEIIHKTGNNGPALSPPHIVSSSLNNSLLVFSIFTHCQPPR